MLFEIHSLGCKVNRYESDCLCRELAARGHSPCGDAPPELIIVNSCTVTAYSDKKTRQLLSALRRNNPSAVIVLAGCMPQAFPEKAKCLTSADIIVGTKNKAELVTLAENFVRSGEKTVSIPQYDGSEEFEPCFCTDFPARTRAEIKIEDGCDCFCSYCIIPYARGRVRSKPLDALRAETKAIAANGYKEIVLTGINLASYGRDFSSQFDVADAVRICSEQEGITRVRLGSLEADLLSTDTIRRLAENEKLCPHFHLSLQSGCAKTLRAMNRHYTPEDFMNLVNTIRESFERPAITTDVIVGFPDETEEDFVQSIRFFNSVGFAMAHIFPYSPREGTAAAKRSDAVSEAVKTSRAKIFRDAAQQAHESFMKSQIGRVVPVLFEHEKEAGFHNGHAPDYTLVKIPAEKFGKSLQNRTIYVTIKKYDYEACYGEPQ